MKTDTIKTDVLKVKTLLDSNNKKELELMLERYLNSYKIAIYAKLDPFSQKKWDDMLF